MPRTSGAVVASWRHRYLGLLVVVSVAILAAPVIVDQLPFLSGETRVTVRNWFNVALENNIGAWWSGCLLLLAGAHAFDGFRGRRDAGDAGMCYAWLVVSVLLVGLSLDEVGSLHERLPVAGLVPIGIAIIGAAAWAFQRLWSDPAERRGVIYMTIGFACFASVAGQEYLEHTVNWPEWAIPLRTAVEEGTELFAMLLLIKVTLHNSGGALHPAEPGTVRPIFSVSHSMPGPMLLAAALALPPVAIGTAMLPDQLVRGTPANWLAATLLLLAALASWRDWLSGMSRSYFGRVGVGILLLAASAATVQVSPRLGEIAGFVFSAKLLVIAVLLLGIAAFVWLRNAPNRHASAYAWLAIGLFTAAFALAAPTWGATYLWTGIVALASLCLISPNIVLAHLDEDSVAVSSRQSRRVN